MRVVNIIHWDDEANTRGFSELDVVKSLKKISIEVRKNDFFPDPEVFWETLKTNDYDLIILDLEHEPEKEEKKGFMILNDIIQKYQNKIPILVYTKHAEKYKSDVNRFRTEFNLKIKLLSKKLRTDSSFWKELNDLLIELLDIKPVFVDILPDNDITTQHAIYKIGLENLKALIGEYSKAKSYNVNADIIKSVKAIAPGYSGAYVLLIEFETYSKLFKISNNYEQITKEYNNLNKYTQQLRSSIKVDYERISPDKIFYNGWYAIVYEYIPHTTSLFSWLSDIKNKNKESEINEVLDTIFSQDGILSLNKVKSKLKLSLNENILIDFDSSRASYINCACEELSIIIKESKNNDVYDKEHLLDSIIEKHSYGYISSTKLKAPTSYQYLSHNDLHANNILLDRRNRPIIIDPGNVQEKHWSFDISRLLVDLIIRGLDIKSIEYFKLETIEKWFTRIRNFIIGEGQIELLSNDSNTGFIIAINWLRSNVNKIYSDHYEEWEFQVGLAVEFLKASYKSVSLPPGKRALAILVACEAIKIANENLKN